MDTLIRDLIQIKICRVTDTRYWEEMPVYHECAVYSASHAYHLLQSHLFLTQNDHGRWNYSGSLQGNYVSRPNREPLYLIFQKYRVEAASVKDFLDRYYKSEPYTGQGPNYAALLLAVCEREFTANGFCITSPPDNITGNPVSFYGPDFQPLTA